MITEPQYIGLLCRNEDSSFSWQCFDSMTKVRGYSQETDKFAPIPEFWELFRSQCNTSGLYCTTDKFSFRGRCPFKVYNALKPDRYRIKIVMLNDSQTFYTYTVEPYVGRVNRQPGESVPSYYIRKLSEPLHGTTWNVTCDTWFTSVEIFDKVLQDHSITMVGTIRKKQTSNSR